MRSQHVHQPIARCIRIKSVVTNRLCNSAFEKRNHCTALEETELQYDVGACVEQMSKIVWLVLEVFVLKLYNTYELASIDLLERPATGVCTERV